MNHISTYSTHCPVLIKVLEMTELMQPNNVLELGMGMFSTPLLHWLCFDQGRKLVSYDNDPIYFDKGYQTEWHDINFVENWDTADIEKSWSVVFVDHRPARRRYHDIKKLANHALVVVVHDTEPEQNKFYAYHRAFSKFKYRYDYTKCKPNTTVLSNFMKLDGVQQ